MIAWQPDAPDNVKILTAPERFLALETTETDDKYVAMAQWTLGADSWGRMVLTSERILRVEVTAGPPPSTDGFLARQAAAELARWRDFSLKRPSEGISSSTLDRATKAVVEWARQTTEDRLRSPLSALNTTGDPRINGNDLTGAELAYLYDAFVKIGEARPTEVLAEKTGISLAAGRNKIYRARKQGLLTATRRGEPGGRLTLKGWEEAQRGPHFPQLQNLINGLFGER